MFFDFITFFHFLVRWETRKVDERQIHAEHVMKKAGYMRDKDTSICIMEKRDVK